MVNGRCESLASPGMNCIAREQCIDNSQCIGNTCQCIQGYDLINGYCIRYREGQCQPTQTMINNQCVTYSVVNGPCVADAQCVGGATCQNGVCQCTPGNTAMYGFCIRDTTTRCNSFEVYVDGQCYPMARAGGPCMYNEQCTGNSQCTNGYCMCSNGVPPTNGMCNAQNTGCKSYQVAVNSQCLDKMSVGQSCINSAQCIANAMCSQTCQCSFAYTYNGTACVTGILYCGQGMVSVSGRCLQLVPLGGNCQYSAQCMGFGTCISSVCMCPRGHSAIDGVCRSNSE
ncbi:hypothetical protein GCK32_014221, partial [Trichostrongylus colubriformis]